jgi:hypothetical protein
MDEGYRLDWGDGKQAEWHGGLTLQIRMHFWLQESNACAYNENHEGRKKALDRCYMEAHTKFKDEERKTCESLKQEVEQELIRINNKKNRHKLIKSKIFGLLNNYESNIRIFADRHKLMNPTQPDPSQAIID